MTDVESNLSAAVALTDQPASEEAPIEAEEAKMDKQPSTDSAGAQPTAEEEPIQPTVTLDAGEFPKSTASEIEVRVRRQSNALQEIADKATTRSLRAYDDDLQTAHNTGSMLPNVSTIIINETDQGTEEYETVIVTLPKAPICALILMEILGIYEGLETVNRWSIQFTIAMTTFVQLGAAIVLYVEKFYEDLEVVSYKPYELLLNVIVMSFVVIYLAQDCAQLYKMVVLLRHLDDATHNTKTLKKRSLGFLYIFLTSNAICYVFLLYFSTVEMAATNGATQKLQVAIAVFFILECDNWLYSVTIDPLHILEDSVFDLHIRGNKGSRNRRFRQGTYWFWGFFTTIVSIQMILFFTKSMKKMTV